MTKLSYDDLFSYMTKLGKSVEPKMEEYLLKEIHPNFSELVIHQTKTGGKRLRPALTLLFSQAFGTTEDEPEALAAAAGIELIHTYSLILDDIIDKGNLRRGYPTVRAKYGDEFAILSAAIYREAVYEAAKSTGKYFNTSISIYSKAIRHITEGERLDILFEQKEDRTHNYFKTHRYFDVSLEDYRKMISGKTASLLAAACRIGAVVGGASLEEQACAEKFGRALGIAFQITDDYLDIFTLSDEFGKEVYKDIIEQKLGNYVVIQALNSLGEIEAHELKLSLTGASFSSEERIKKCLPLIESSNAKNLTMKEAERWVQKSKMILQTINFKNESFRTLLEKIADFTVTRAF